MRVKNLDIPIAFKERASQLFTQCKRIYSNPFDQPYITDIRTANTNQAGKSRMPGLHRMYKFEGGRWWTGNMMDNGSVYWK